MGQGWLAERKGRKEFVTYQLTHSFPPSDLSQPTSLDPRHCCRIPVAVELISVVVESASWSSWSSNPHRGRRIRVMVVESVSWSSNPRRGGRIRVVVVESTSWWSDPHHGCQIHVVVVESTLWLSNPHRGCRIRVVVVESTSFGFHC